MTRMVLGYAVLVVGLAWPMFAQPALAQPADAGRAPDDPSASSPEYGVRFTPVMARALAQKLTKSIFVQHYELDETKTDQAAELVARRLMQFAHRNEEVCQDVLEFVVMEGTNLAAKTKGQGLESFPLSMAQGIGARVVPIMPSIRDLTNGVLLDVRPMLGFKQQIKMTGEIAAVNVSLDMVEKNMRNWAKGDMDPMDPFRNEEEEFKKDEKGQTGTLRQARSMAETVVGATPGADWDEYVEDAKRYFALDPAQAAAADSLLREYKERAQGATGDRAAWQARRYRNRFLCQMATALPGRWENPLRVLLDNEDEKQLAPVATLGDELKRRIEEISTQAQREAAEQRVQSLLDEKGLKLEEPAATTAPATEPTPATAEEVTP